MKNELKSFKESAENLAMLASKRGVSKEGWTKFRTSKDWKDNFVEVYFGSDYKDFSVRVKYAGREILEYTSWSESFDIRFNVDEGAIRKCIVMVEQAYKVFEQEADKHLQEQYDNLMREIENMETELQDLKDKRDSVLFKLEELKTTKNN